MAVWTHEDITVKRCGAQQQQVDMIVFVGAESTGKSTLAQHLADRLGAGFVPEIGRFIWEEKQGRLNAGDYVEISERHRAAEDAVVAVESGPYVFVDTNALTTLLLGQCFGQVTEPAPPTLLRHADECHTRYLHHFVCADDIPYEEEPGVRENANWRTHIQRLVLDDLERRAIGFTVLTGTLEERAEKVMQVLSGIEQDKQITRAAA